MRGPCTIKGGGQLSLVTLGHRELGWGLQGLITCARGISMLIHECWEVSAGSEAGGGLTSDSDRFLGGWGGGREKGEQVREDWPG